LKLGKSLFELNVSATRLWYIYFAFATILSALCAWKNRVSGVSMVGIASGPSRFSRVAVKVKLFVSKNY